MRQPTIRIFLSEGEPEGIRVISKTNWVGIAVVAPRTALGRAKKQRVELDGPGIYILYGEDEGKKKIYIGEADVLKDRLSQHDGDKDKDFWTHFVAFSCKDDILNKAIIGHIESKLIEKARSAKTWEVVNKQNPKGSTLSEIDRGAAEEFMEEMLLIYPVLGITAFETLDSSSSEQNDQKFCLKERGAMGEGLYHDKGFIVLKGSIARVDEVKSISPAIKMKREELVKNDVLIKKEKGYVFNQDYVFSSPSQAASVLVGGPANGRTSWKDCNTGKTLKEVFE